MTVTAVLGSGHFVITSDTWVPKLSFGCWSRREAPGAHPQQSPGPALISPQLQQLFPVQPFKECFPHGNHALASLRPQIWWTWAEEGIKKATGVAVLPWESQTEEGGWARSALGISRSKNRKKGINPAPPPCQRGWGSLHPEQSLSLARALSVPLSPEFKGSAVKPGASTEVEQMREREPCGNGFTCALNGKVKIPSHRLRSKSNYCTVPPPLAAPELTKDIEP